MACNLFDLDTSYISNIIRQSHILPFDKKNKIRKEKKKRVQEIFVNRLQAIRVSLNEITLYK